MPRPKFLKSHYFPYYVSARCFRNEKFKIPLNEVWSIMIEELAYAHQSYKLSIHAFVLMDNQFHLICDTPNGNLDQIMQHFLSLTSRRINKMNVQNGKLWCRGYKWSLITQSSYYFQVFRYVYQIPSRKLELESTREYSFSTYHQEPGLFQLLPPPVLRRDVSAFLEEQLSSRSIELISKGLMKHKFDLPKRRYLEFSEMTKPYDWVLDTLVSHFSRK